MAPWPNQPCPYFDCLLPITDLLVEMVPNADRGMSAFKAIVGQVPGGSITCPYCQRGVEYDADGMTLVQSTMTPLRYSRTKMELRAKDYEMQKCPSDPNMTPEQWIAEEKLMYGALLGYRYVEDLVP